MKPEGIECEDWQAREDGSRVCRYYLPGGTCEQPARLLCEEWQRRGEPSYDVEAFAIVGKSSIPRDTTKPNTPNTTAPGKSTNTSSTPNAAPKSNTSNTPKSNTSSTPHSALRIPTAADLLQAPPRKDRDEVPRSPEDFVLKPSGTIKATSGTPAERARAAFAAKQTNTTIEVAKPYEAAKRIDPERIAALAATFPEVVLDSAEVGQVALVAAPTGRDDRVELTYEDAATLRLIVDAFPGARVTGLKSSKEARGASSKTTQEAARTNTPLPEETKPSDAAEPEIDPFALDSAEDGAVDPFALDDDQVPF